MQAVHLLLTYECTRSCPHCFVWGDPGARGTTMSGEQLEQFLDQISAVPDVDMVFFEGGEPFLHYSLLLAGAEGALARGLRWGVVSNGDWACSRDAAMRVLGDLKERDISSLTLSTDAYHSQTFPSPAICRAVEGAQALDVPALVLATEGPHSKREDPPDFPVELAWGQVMYRGRAAHFLSAQSDTAVRGQDCTACTQEQLDAPTRVHLDRFGYVHLCQGLALGRVEFGTTLRDVMARYQPKHHPIAGPLLAGGPRALALAYAEDALEQEFSDPCHMCYSLRSRLRHRFPHLLGPPHVYGLGSHECSGDPGRSRR